jgi:MFS family permease
VTSVAAGPANATEAPAPGRKKRTIAGPLSVPNFRIYLGGQVVSQCGTQMQTIGLAWLVLELTKSGGDLGLLLFLTYVPALIVGPWGGVVADRLNKRRGVIATQSLQLLCAVLLATLTISGVVSMWMLYVQAFVNGSLSVIDMPLRQVLVHEMVSDEYLQGALGLTTSLGYASMTFGPAIAGIVIVHFGVSTCFVVNAVSFLAVLASLLVLDRSAMLVAAPVARARGQIREGLRMVWHTRLLRSTFLMLLVVGTFGFSYNVVLPLLASKSFAGGAGAYGLLATMMGLGSVAGSLTGAALHRTGPKRLIVAALAFGCAAIVTAMMPTVGAAAALLLAFGATFAGFVVTANLTVQLSVAPSIRGRVMSLYGIVFWGSTALAGLLAGQVSDLLGPRAVLVVDGVGILLAAAVAAVSFHRVPMPLATVAAELVEAGA